VRWGLGLGPSPLLCQPKSYFNSINKIKPYSLRNTMGRLVARALPKHYPHLEVAGSTPVESQNFYHLQTTGGVPRGTIPLAKNNDTCHHWIRPLFCQRLPSQHANASAMSLYGCMECTISCHVNNVRIVQSAKFCLFGKMNRTRYLAHTTSV
jgi:hypothetical protein